VACARVASTVGEVLALDGNGQLHRFDAMAGTPLGMTEVGAFDGLAVARDGLTAVLGAGAIQLFGSGRRPGAARRRRAAGHRRR